MSKVLKAGCILINNIDKTIALVYREKQNDYSFPKGHLEEGESLIECAIRETAEETKRDCIILEDNPIYIEEYVTPSGEDVRLYYYISRDIGLSYNTSEDTHDTYWIPFEEVERYLTYDSLKEVWKSIKNKVYRKMFMDENQYVDIRIKEERKQFVESLEEKGYIIEKSVFSRNEIINGILPIVVNMQNKSISMLGNVTSAAAAASSRRIITKEEFEKIII